MTDLQRRVLCSLYAAGYALVTSELLPAAFSLGMRLREAIRGLVDKGLVKDDNGYYSLTPAGRALFDKLGVEA